MRKYYVCYKMHSAEPLPRKLEIVARNKYEAYDKALYEVIVPVEGLPYSAWVDSVRMANGKVKTFNTFEGKPY